MSFFSNLPDDVCISVLSEYCEMKDLSALDAAFCNKMDRASLLEIYSNDWFFIEGSGYSYCDAMKWVSTRSIKLQNLVLFYNTFIGNKLKYEILTSHVLSFKKS